MITVYFWPPMGADAPSNNWYEDVKGFERFFGHTALLIENSGSYLSFWPDSPDKKLSLLREFLVVPSKLL